MNGIGNKHPEILCSENTLFTSWVKYRRGRRQRGEQRGSSPVQAPYHCLWIFEHRALWTHVRVPLHQPAADRSEIPALTGLQGNHMSMNKAWLWERRAGSQNNTGAGMLPRMSKCLRSGRKRTIQPLEAHKITWSQTQIQKYALSVASAKHFGTSSGKSIYLTFSSEVTGEASNNWWIGSRNLWVSSVSPWAGNVEYRAGPWAGMRKELELGTGSGEM